jgi:ergothioneine biosynthesis protein EgtB
MITRNARSASPRIDSPAVGRTQKGSPSPPPSPKEELLRQYQAVRQATEALCATLEPEDYVLQTMPEMSPTKWHLAHTSWFFETFVARPFLAHYRPLNEQYAFLFNSYYNAAGKMHARPQRGLISRPTVNETFTYRQHVDTAIEGLIESAEPGQLERLVDLITLGLHHEQQHQELMLTDIKHAFWMNPLRPEFRPADPGEGAAWSDLEWRHYKEGIYYIGHHGGGFHYDNEGPRHREFLSGFSIATRLVTNREYLAFMADEGYRRPELWLSLGWTAVNERGWQAPFYWEERAGEWWVFTLAGMQKLELEEPVCHVSYFEADAYARWAGARLATEAEWEVASRDVALEGHFVEAGHFHPAPLRTPGPHGDLHQMFGDVWQWTQSAYAPYPGYRPAAGALGEYNGKFMCNQYVLRGASCATPRTHARRTYRNFFPPDARWQFAGIRLARDPQPHGNGKHSCKTS